MLDLPGLPVLDKTRLIGHCARLPLALDGVRLAAEVATLPESFWGTSAGRVGVHRAADAVFLRGFAPAAGDLPIEDRPALDHLPYVREILRAHIRGWPLRCLLARLPPDGTIAAHVDHAPYFTKTVRIHVPVATSDRAWMVCGGLTYLMRPGEVWALNNSAVHAVWNAHPTQSRTHLICDFLPTPALLDLLARADRSLGCSREDVNARLGPQHLPAARPG